jgi:hypothetical protein
VWMAEDYKVQLSTTINGNLLNLRAESPEELEGTVTDLAARLDNIVSGLVQIKEGIILKDLFTGTASPGKGGNSNSNSNSNSSSSGTPRCKHGEMKDLTAKNYKSTHYCPEPDRDKQCKPVNLRS